MVRRPPLSGQQGPAVTLEGATYGTWTPTNSDSTRLMVRPLDEVKAGLRGQVQKLVRLLAIRVGEGGSNSERASYA
jgi:hypothetical protein